MDIQVLHTLKRKLAYFLRRFYVGIKTRPSRQHFRTYIQGQLSDLERKTSSSSCRSCRAGDTGGARDGRPTPSRYRHTETGSVNAATIFSCPPQAGHAATSTWNTRAKSLAHATHFAGSIAVDDEGFIYVADVGNRRIQKFAP